MAGPIIAAEISAPQSVTLLDVDGTRRATVRLPAGTVKNVRVRGPMLTAQSSDGRIYVYDVSRETPTLRYAR